MSESEKYADFRLIEKCVKYNNKLVSSELDILGSACYRATRWGKMTNEEREYLTNLLNRLSSEQGNVKEKDHDSISSVVASMNSLSNDERVAVFSFFCVHCGSTDPGCFCMRDE